MRRLVFVYGTLMRGYDHPMARLLADNAEYLGEARCRGRLYLVKHYPGLVLSNDPADVVFGDLFDLRPGDIIDKLDAYEGCGKDDPPPTQYLRQELVVSLGDQPPITAWTYVYNRPVASLERIESGQFLDHPQAKAAL